METKRIHLPVDAGNISIISQTLIDKYGLRQGNYADSYIKLGLRKNEHLTVLVKGTWVGKVDGSVSAQKGETYYIGDACYFIEDWNRFLSDTNFMDNLPDGNASLSTGGDGEFEVVINPSLREMCEKDEEEDLYLQEDEEENEEENEE